MVAVQLLHDKELETKKMGKVQGTWLSTPLGSYAVLQVMISTRVCTFLMLFFMNTHDRWSSLALESYKWCFGKYFWHAGLQ